jgi:hypothetical protein
MVDRNKQNVVNKFICMPCGYSTSRKHNFIKHKTTNKHGMMTNAGVSVTESSTYVCECGMEYRHRQSLCVHRKRCGFMRDEVFTAGTSKKNPENEEISKAELLNMIQSIIPMIGGNTVNTIHNNINIQLFLDDKCKDAMSIQNFAEQLTMTLEDILQQRRGIHVGVPNIVIKNLRPIPLMERPIHCCDEKNHTWMVKDERDGWKEESGKTMIKVASIEINKRFQKLWNKKYPNWQKDEHLQSSWLELIKCLNGVPTDTDIEKALKKIGLECTLTNQEIREILSPD